MIQIQTTISKIKYVLLVLFVAFSFSCNPEDGEDGNANIISSGWVAYDATNWTPVYREFLVDYRDYPITVPEITQDVVDNGVVLVYTRFVVTDTQTYMLPFTENVISASGEIVNFRFALNDLTIKMRKVSGIGDPGIFGDIGIVEYRYIIIPSNNIGKMKSADFSKMTYEEVMNYFDLDY